MKTKNRLVEWHGARTNEKTAVRIYIVYLSGTWRLGWIGTLLFEVRHWMGTGVTMYENKRFAIQNAQIPFHLAYNDILFQ